MSVVENIVSDHHEQYHHCYSLHCYAEGTDTATTHPPEMNRWNNDHDNENMDGKLSCLSTNAFLNRLFLLLFKTFISHKLTVDWFSFTNKQRPFVISGREFFLSETVARILRHSHQMVDEIYMTSSEGTDNLIGCGI
jgi:hypothetical protein